uniref:RIC1 domain-containing protein n=1 Tax=Mesocestoides corti TaxID=53468 RepID=A0A5K3FHL8_MESCO
MEECEQFLFELRATTSSEKSETPLVSFAWHGSIVNCIITIDRAGCLNVAKVHELTAVTWSPNHTLLWTCGSTWLGLDRTGLFGPRGYVVSRRGKSDGLKTSSNLNKSIIDGFTKVAAKLGDNLDSVIQRRADAGYGLEVQNTPYSAIVADDPQLRSLWVLIEYLQEYIEDWAPPGKCHDTPWGGVRGRVGAGGTGACDLRCQGAMAILCSGKAAASEVAESCEWHGIDASLTFPRYSSPERSRILRMCMWPLDASSDAQRRVFESVCGDMEFERAAAMALINLQFDWALSFLSRASECRRSKENGDAAANEADRNGASLASASSALSATETDLTGLALSGFSDPRNQFWRSTCADVLARLNNPYLRFMFKFLTCSRGDRGDIKDFKEILENEDLILIDRLAFACLYLNDQELRDYVRSTFEHMLQGGRLEAVLLTGLSSPEFFDLLQRYVDLTSDVQTAAILGLHACSLCRYPTPGPPIGSSLGVRRGSGQSQASNRFRVRSGKDVGDTTKSTPSTPPGDQLVAKLGGRRLTNW